MWQLSQRRLKGNPTKKWTELGRFTNISSATEKIIKIEGYTDGALFLKMWVDTWLDPEDQKLFERLEHTSERAFYVIRRAVN